MNKSDISEQIKKAFPERPLSDGEIREWRKYVELFEEMPDSEERDTYNAYGLRSWPAISDELILGSFMSVHSLPHEAFNYYLPRLMIAALEHPFELSMERMVARMIHSSYSPSSLSDLQREAVLALCDFYIKNNFFNSDYLAENLESLRNKLSTC